MIKKIITLAVFSSALCFNAISMDIEDSTHKASKKFPSLDENDENQVNNGQDSYETPRKYREDRVLAESCVLSPASLSPSFLNASQKKASGSLSAKKLPTVSTPNVKVRNMYVSPDQDRVLVVNAKGSFDIDSTLLFKDEKIESGAELKTTTLDLVAGMYHLTKHSKLTNAIRSKIQTDRLPGNFASFELTIIGSDDYMESYTSDEIFVSGMVDSDESVLSCAHYKLPYDVPEGEEERACSELALLGFLDETIGQKIEKIRTMGIDLQKIQLRIHSERDLCFNCKRVVPDWAQKKSVLYGVPVHVIALSQLDYCTPSAPCCSTCPFIPTLKMSRNKKKVTLAKIEESKKEKVLRTPERKSQRASFNATSTDSESEGSIIDQRFDIFLTEAGSNSDKEGSDSADTDRDSGSDFSADSVRCGDVLSCAPVKKVNPGKAIFSAFIRQAMGDTIKTLF